MHSVHSSLATSVDSTRAVDQASISVVIPCYKVRSHILNVIAQIPESVSRIYVVDDCCPEGTGRYVQSECEDPRVQPVIFHEQNKGVGGAMISGYRAALAAGATVVVKIDGDGQMDPRLLDRFVGPILAGKADYTKGNRFFDIELVASMPRVRLFGNSVVSLINKLVCGYWNIMDPSNGYTAIHATALRLIPLNRIAERYFFESDMLFQLNIARAVVMDIPMEARYADEKSSMNIANVAVNFPGKYVVRFFKRIFYNYFLRDFNAGTVELVLGTLLIAGGVAYGVFRWGLSIESGMVATSGQVMLSALPILLGFQLLISAVAFDISHVPTVPLHVLLSSPRTSGSGAAKRGL
jgi:glycosyltransferase involved in cell wall biosynthesis